MGDTTTAVIKRGHKNLNKNTYVGDWNACVFCGAKEDPKTGLYLQGRFCCKACAMTIAESMWKDALGQGENNAVGME